MADKREVVVLSAVRSAVGTFNGSLAGMEPADLGGLVIKEAIARSGVDPQAVTFATVGNVVPTEVPLRLRRIATRPSRAA
jgi:acetyl-CoA C-acetyltransferase